MKKDRAEGALVALAQYVRRLARDAGEIGRLAAAAARPVLEFDRENPGKLGALWEKAARAERRAPDDGNRKAWGHVVRLADDGDLEGATTIAEQLDAPLPRGRPKSESADDREVRELCKRIEAGEKPTTAARTIVEGRDPPPLKEQVKNQADALVRRWRRSTEQKSGK